MKYNTYVFVSESGEDFDFPQRSLTVGLVLKGGNFFDGNFCFCHGVHCRSVIKKGEER